MNYHSAMGLGAATDFVSAVAHAVALGFNAAAVATIVLVSITALVRFCARLRKPDGSIDAALRFRTSIGRGVLLGLELLVAADIIGTIAVTPSFSSLGILALVIAIRTFLSVSLTVEIDGTWPWRRQKT